MTAAPICEWFALCTREAAGVVEHPALGYVPVCLPCANKLALPLVDAEWIEADQ